MELSSVDQLWVADLTYIRLLEEFVYLAVVLDAYSRKVVGWSRYCAAGFLRQPRWMR
jgi:transposase InsO family protein